MPVDHQRLSEIKRRLGPLHAWLSEWGSAEPRQKERRLKYVREAGMGRTGALARPVYASDGRQWKSAKFAAASFECSLSHMRKVIEEGRKINGVFVS